jgi:hypothetical protein
MSSHDHDLTDDERRAFAALDRERDPGRLLEERTVRALRAQGLLQVPVPAAPPHRRVRPAWIGAAAAAAAAVFLGGMALGQQMGSRAAAQAFAAGNAQSAEQAANAVQRTGSAYVTALSRFAELSDADGGGMDPAARAAAVQLLHAAADELLRIAPDDAVATGILAGHADGLPAETVDGARRVVWF